MNIKEKLKEIRNKLLENGTEKIKRTTVEESKTQLIGNTNHESNFKNNQFVERKNIDLNTKVDNFLAWYYENMIKGNCTDIGELKEMRNLIEKIAIWYELRYPNYEINRLMHCCGQEEISIDNIMFKNNSYVNDLLDKDSDIRELNWDDFYNKDVFIKALPCEERYYFTKPRFRDIVYLESNSRIEHLHLTKNGFVEMAEGITNYTKGIITDEELRGLNVRKVVNLFKEKKIGLPKNNDLESSIKNVENLIYQKEEMLNCVMYRIIERGGNRIGPRRAFLFAKEFGRNIDIPMMYAVDRSDPGLRLFINEYIKSGGSKDLKCYMGYFWRKNKKVYTISIQDLIIEQRNDAATFYTPEEDELHQRLVDIINSQVDHEIVKKEEIKKLRLERKLEKRRNNN